MKRKLSPWCKEAKKALIDRDMTVTELSNEVGIYKNFQKDAFSDVVFFIPIYTQSPRLSLSAEYPVCSILTGYS